jgi:diguanylate cyclase (GGDEF)-like protein
MTREIQEAWDRQRSGGEPFGFVIIDLDGFKQVNDWIGPDQGDEVLRDVARRLQAAVHDGFVSRFGGDEFAVLRPALSAAEVSQHAREMLDLFDEPFTSGAQPVRLAASAGVASWPTQTDPSDAIRSASIALRDAKRDGGAVSAANPAMEASWETSRSLEIGIADAVLRGQLVLEYQPMYDLRNGAIVGAEALVRWEHPEQGRIPPGDFIPTAEATGAIVEIGEWVRATACAQLQEWRREFPDLRFTMRVNLSEVELHQADLTERILELLRVYELEPAALELELTESVIHDDEKTLQRMHDLSALGVRIAVDDFGTGYSSLACLRKLPAHTLKIDRAFVNDLCESEAGEALVQTVIELAKTLELETVAEGIEEAEQLDRLRDLDCTLGQGFHLARPMRAQALRKLLLAESGSVRVAA